MNRLAAVALIIVGLAIPVCAQRAASRGGFSGHAAQASRGGFSASASNRFAASPRYSGRTLPIMARSLQRSGAANFSARRPYTGASRYRWPYLSPYGARIPYVYPAGPGPYFIGYPDAFGYDDFSTSPDYAPGEYDAQPADQGQQASPGAYQPPYGMSHQSLAPASEQAVNLFFKDGRPPLQIHNYLLTRTTLFVEDGHHREIPTDQLDLAATAELNHDAGVDFRLPDAPR
jgi:hypothetical protein